VPGPPEHADDAYRPLSDFERWAALAQSDPAAFEEKRIRAIEKLLQNVPEHKRQRLRCLQWKIDQVRGRCATPMSACVKLSGMMWESVVGPGGLSEALERLGDAPTHPLPQARILKLKQASRR
jgi:hypothetical protein